MNTSRERPTPNGPNLIRLPDCFSKLLNFEKAS
jgi:hypothetical protein